MKQPSPHLRISRLQQWIANGLPLFFLLACPLFAAEPPENAKPPADPGKTAVVEAAENQATIPVDVEWSPVPGATRYRVEVRDNQQKVVKQEETAETRMKIELPPGSYEKRVGLLNKFNRLYLWSEWAPLQIIRILQPKLDVPPGVSPIVRGGGQKSITVKTQGVMPQTRYHLRDRKGNITEVPVHQKGEELVIDVNPDRLPPGEYDLVMQNPEGKEDINRGTFKIEPSPTEKATIRRQNLSALMLLPGLPQRERNQTLKGNALMIAFWTSAAFTAYSYQNAARIYRRLNGDPLYAIFKDSTTATVAGPAIASNSFLYNSALVSYGNWRSDTAKYNRFRVYYYGGAILTSGLLAYHLVDVYRFDIGLTRTSEGEPGLGAALSLSF